jgi:hypothetical protein
MLGPGQRHPSVESVFEYGSLRNFRVGSVCSAPEKLVMVSDVATALPQNRPAVEAMRKLDWEIVCHA